jgi:hypothetical protein
MSILSNNPARRWAAELRARRSFRWHRFRSWLTYGRDRRAWDGYWWNRFRSWVTYGRASTLAFAATIILSVALVGLLSLGRGGAPRLLGGAFTLGVTDAGVPYVALDPEALGQAQGGAPKDGASRGSGASAVVLFSVDTSGGFLPIVGGEGSSVGNDPQPAPGPNPGPGPSPDPSPGPSPSPTPPPTRTEPPPTNTEPPPTNTEPPPTNTEPPPTNTQPPPTNTEPPPTNTEPPPTNTEPPPTNTEPPPTNTEPPPTNT